MNISSRAPHSYWNEMPRGWLPWKQSFIVQLLFYHSVPTLVHSLYNYVCLSCGITTGDHLRDKLHTSHAWRRVKTQLDFVGQNSEFLQGTFQTKQTFFNTQQKASKQIQMTQNQLVKTLITFSWLIRLLKVQTKLGKTFQNLKPDVHFCVAATVLLFLHGSLLRPSPDYDRTSQVLVNTLARLWTEF